MSGWSSEEDSTLSRWTEIMCSPHVINKNGLTVLLQFGKAVITDTCWLVLQVLQVVLVGRAGLTHHLLNTQAAVTTVGGLNM